MSHRGAVLVADDEEIVLKVVSIVLEDAGYTVLVARDGREAVEVFERHVDEIRAAVLDLSMPELSGEEAMHALRALRPDLPVVLSSGAGAETLSAELAGGDPTVFVQKPYTADALLAALAGLTA